MSCYCDTEPASFYAEYIVTARKEHKCYECRGKISRGARYYRICGKWDDFQSFRLCSVCSAGHETIKSIDECGCGAPLGDLYSAFREMLYEHPFEVGWCLAVAATAKVVSA